MPFVALQGRPLQSATIGYAITPNPIRPKYSPKGVSFTDLIRIFAMSTVGFSCLYLQH